MPDTTDQSQVSASSSGKKKPMIKLPEWLGKPGVEFLARVSATALVFWMILSFVIGVHICHVQSGQPMIKDGDLYVTFRLSSPARGDVVVYRHDGTISFGRVYALSGERVQITPQAVLADGFRQPDSEGYDTGLPDGSSFECTVPQDCVFVLNDNRDDLSDSRILGGIPLTECEGTVILLIRRRGF
jgi:signal peptidase I, bacterial type